MLLSWLRARKRRRLTAVPLADSWKARMECLPFFRALAKAEQERLADLVKVFVAEKRWEGCGGLEMTDEIRVVVASQACRLILHLDHDYFRTVRSILVYPSAYWGPNEPRRNGGLVTEARTPRAGEAWRGGEVVLSWEATVAGGADAEDGHNVVYHEFAHKLDMLDGCIDGTPPLRGREQYEAWTEIMQTEFSRLRESASHSRTTFLDPYGATNPAEFFAVCTELFFERPARMRSLHPGIYGLLAAFYRQDPGAA